MRECPLFTRHSVHPRPRERGAVLTHHEKRLIRRAQQEALLGADEWPQESGGETDPLRYYDELLSMSRNRRRKTSSFDSCRSPLINNTDKYRFVTGFVVEYLSDRVRAALRR